MQQNKLSVTLVVPLYNESDTVDRLYHSIELQSRKPDKILFVDAGSEDNTAEKLNQLIGSSGDAAVLRIGRANPGEGRNAGTKAAVTEWIAYTDAGITLDKDWLKELAKVAEENAGADLVYGNYHPEIRTFFDLLSAYNYLPPQGATGIRGKSIASCLIKKELWVKAGGFPPFRAAEDLIFMAKAEQAAKQIVFAPDAAISWQLRPGWNSVFKKFRLYSMHNIWAGKAKDWHYGVVRQYALLLPFIFLSVFVNAWFIVFAGLWFWGRAFKRVYMHRFQFGLCNAFNPVVLTAAGALACWIDLATFTGWLDAYTKKRK